jgi:hypothetical protein
VESVRRAGYSPDEEISFFAVRGISSAGLPRLPSGALYQRGLAYSYAAWAAGRVFGDDLRAYRLPSLLGGCIAVGLTALLAARLGGSPFLAGLLAAGATWLVVTSGWARFYSLFLAAFLATTLTLLAPPSESRRRDRWFLAGLVASRLLHEMAVTLLALPAFYLFQSPPASAERRRFGGLLLRSVLTLVCVQAALAALSRSTAGLTAPTALIDTAAGAPRLLPALLSLSSVSGLVLLGTVAVGVGLGLRLLRASWAFCVVAAVCCATLNLGLLALATAALVLARPQRARGTAIAGLVAGVTSVALWAVYVSWHTASAWDWALVSSLGQAGLAFPLGGVAELVRRWPLAAGAALAGLGLGWGTREVRLTAFLALAVLAFLGVVALGPKPRYFLPLLPLLFVLAAILPGTLEPSVRGTEWLPRLAATGAAVLLACLLLVEHEHGGRDTLLEAGGPFGLSRLRTAPFERWAALLGQRATEGPIVCNDDLGCLLIGRHPTHWWLSSTIEAERYGVRDAAGWRSNYTSARILVGDEAERALVSKELRGGWLIALDTVKYPGPARITASDVGPGLETVCAAEGMLVLRVHGDADRPEVRSAKETPPCSSS